MRVQVKQLLYWKTEHGNVKNCQDAPFYDTDQGLFAVADGAGTSLFPALWAQILAKHFVTIPLMSEHPFEVEWWVRLAQSEYKQQMPDIHKAGAWNIMQKVRNQGSDSTLATLRVTSVEAMTAQAMLLVFGDSCVLMGNPVTQTVSSFILQHPSEFDRAPICVPSDLKYFNRDFHRCQTLPITLNAGDQIIIATDAVSRWILGRGETADVWAAFQQIYQCLTLDEWYAFVDSKRQQKEMVNDDSTALVLTFSTDDSGVGMQFGATDKHTYEVITQRQNTFEEAVRADNKELVAISYGDGRDLRSVATTPPLDAIDIAHIRDVADALKEVLRAFRQFQNSPDLVQKVTPFWSKYGPLLQDEPCAANLRETLRNNGIIRPAPPTQKSEPVIVPVQVAIPAQEKQVPDIDLEKTLLIQLPEVSSPPAIDLQDQQRQHEMALQKIQRKAQFFQSLYEKNTDKIVTAYQELQKAGDQETLAGIDLADRQKIEQIIQERSAWANFDSAIQQGANPETLLRVYDEVRQTNPSQSLLQQYADLLQLAQEFVRAWGTNDSYALTKAYTNINRSGFKINFTKEEMERIGQAEDAVKRHTSILEQTIVARVGNVKIALKNFAIFYIIKRLYMAYTIVTLESQISSGSSDKNTKPMIEQLTRQLQSAEFPYLVLEESIEDILIHREMKAMAQQDEVLQEQLQADITRLAENLQRYEAQKSDHYFRRYNIGVEEMKRFARTVVERQWLIYSLERQKKPSLWRLAHPRQSALDDWLKDEKEREKNNIFFTETDVYAAVDPRMILSKLEEYIKKYIYVTV